MPRPAPGQTEEEYLDQCIPALIEEGYEPDQAVAVCLAYYSGQKDKAYSIPQDGRIAYWKAFDAKREALVPKYTRVTERAIRAFIEPLRTAVDWQDFRRYLPVTPIEKLYEQLYSEVGDIFARQTYDTVRRKVASTGASTKYLISKGYGWKNEYPDWLARLVAYAREDGSKRIVDVSDSLRKQINDIIVEGLEDGASIEDVRDRIIGTGIKPLNGTVEVRARRIARTEIVSASNLGSLEGMNSTGLDYWKTWLSTPDLDTRDAHRDANGDRVRKGERFYVMGQYLNVPGDPQGKPANVINCRCTQTYDFEELDTPVAQGNETPDKKLTAREIFARDLAKEVRPDDFVEIDDAKIGYANIKGMHAKYRTWLAKKRQTRPNDPNPIQGFIAEERGFAGLPTILSEEEWATILADKTKPAFTDFNKSPAELKGKNKNRRFVMGFRGVEGSDVNRYRQGLTTNQMVEEFKDGEMFHGLGVYGNGTYAAHRASTAIEYAGGEKNLKGVMQFFFDREAFRTIGYQTLTYLTRDKKKEWIADIMRDILPIVKRRKPDVYKDFLEKAGSEEALVRMLIADENARAGLLLRGSVKLQDIYDDLDFFHDLTFDQGALATFLGYDMILGNEGSETYFVILNRTLLRIRNVPPSKEDLKPWL